MTPFLDDPDFRLYVGDALDVLRELDDASVDCCVTSPPYWGLRDYGTGGWEGGDPGCDHARHVGGPQTDRASFRATAKEERRAKQFGAVCGKCGATRADRQIGLEATPAEYVETLVALFGEVRRVLAPHGTVWLNLGDSYCSAPAGNTTPSGFSQTRPKRRGNLEAYNTQQKSFDGLKPKDLVGVPWRVALALQNDGWYLRSDIIWSKPNPMPESVTDRPTKSHEYVFLLAKSERYYFDQEAVRESYTNGMAAPDASTLPGLPPETPRGPDGRRKTSHDHSTASSHENHAQIGDGRSRWPSPTGRNVRTVWEIATQPYAAAHFATFPEELPRRCIAAAVPEHVCRTCGTPRERITRPTEEYAQFLGRGYTDHERDLEAGMMQNRGVNRQNEMIRAGITSKQTETVGWTNCGHDDWRVGVVLDPFCGAGTTALVARKLGRACVGIELSPEYARLIADRLSQLSLFAEATP